MDKISISDFCGEEKTYAQLIQDLYFHISVKELYMVLASNAAQNRDVYESVSYRNTYSSLENRIPDVCRMTVGELLRYATEKCLSGRNMEELYDEDSIKLGYKIIKALLVDLFQSYAHSKRSYHWRNRKRKNWRVCDPQYPPGKWEYGDYRYEEYFI